MDITIRAAKAEDAGALLEIYRWYVENNIRPIRTFNEVRKRFNI